LIDIPVQTRRERAGQPALARHDEQLLALAGWPWRSSSQHFMRFAQFGFYEDDYWSVAASVGLTARDVWAGAELLSILANRAPLNHLLPVLGTLGLGLGVWRQCNALAAAWLVVNTWLVYRIAQKCFPSLRRSPRASLMFSFRRTRPASSSFTLRTFRVRYLFAGWALAMASRRRGTCIRYPIAGVSLLSYENRLHFVSLVLPSFLPTALSFVVSSHGRPRRWLRNLLGLVVMARAVNWRLGRYKGRPTTAS